MDDKDRQIIRALQRNSRMTNQDLAAEVNLSPSPCLRRVKLLEQCGALKGYTADIDAQVAGSAGLLLLSSADTGSAAAAAAAAAADPIAASDARETSAVQGRSAGAVRARYWALCALNKAAAVALPLLDFNAGDSRLSLMHSDLAQFDLCARSPSTHRGSASERHCAMEQRRRVSPRSLAGAVSAGAVSSGGVSGRLGHSARAVAAAAVAVVGVAGGS